MTPHTLNQLLTAPYPQAWEVVRQALLGIWSEPYSPGNELSHVHQREEAVAPMDMVLSHCVWNLWKSFIPYVPRASVRLKEHWAEHPDGRAALILDGLSLRELPVLCAQATKRGFTVHNVDALASELPADTNSFAKALGFSSRSALDNNGGASAAFPDAHTLSNGLPWTDAAASLPPAPNILFWHHWPDDRLHQLDGADGGIDKLLPEAVKHLSSDAFWQFVRTLARNRRLIITADHGYAATGAFFNVSPDQKEYLRENFAAQRSRAGYVESKTWLPPLTAHITTPSGVLTFVTGRTKWQVPGGFPSLSHGGLTLMETFVPWLEISI